jgi:hypothetical protein
MMKKLALTLLFGILGVGVYGQTIKTLGYNTTNGQVVYAGTNKLTFTNAVSLHTGNYSDGGTGTTVDLARALWDVANDDWALNCTDNEFQFNGTNRRDNFRIALGLGWSALTNSNAATSLLGFTTNGQVVDNTGTNVLRFELGNGVIIGGDNGTKLTVNSESLSFYSQPQDVTVLHIPADDTVQLNGGYWNDPSVRASLGFSTNLNTFWTATNSSNARSAVGLGWSALTNSNAATSLLGVATNGNVVYAGTNNLTFTNTVFFGNDTSINTSSGINYGSSEVINLEERTLVGDWTIAGGLVFFNATNAATARTNLGLGNGITTNRTFVSYDGTNYTTNSVTISNGIITGWTQ